MPWDQSEPARTRSSGVLEVVRETVGKNVNLIWLIPTPDQTTELEVL